MKVSNLAAELNSYSCLLLSNDGTGCWLCPVELTVEIFHFPLEDCYLLVKSWQEAWFLFAGGWQDETWPDGWTAVTRDGKRSAQFEHTLLVTDTGCEILTRRLDSIRPHFMTQ